MRRIGSLVVLFLFVWSTLLYAQDEGLLVPKDMLDRYFQASRDYASARDIHDEDAAYEANLSLLSLRKKLGDSLFLLEPVGAQRQTILDSYQKTLELILAHADADPEGTAHLRNYLQVQRWEKRYGVFDRRVWLQKGQSYGAASGILLGLTALKLATATKKVLLSESLTMAGHLLPALGAWSGPLVGQRLHSTSQETFGFPPVIADWTAYGEADDQISQEKLMALTAGWAASMGTLSVARSGLQWLKGNASFIKGAKWNVGGFLLGIGITQAIEPLFQEAIHSYEVQKMDRALYQIFRDMEQIRSSTTLPNRTPAQKMSLIQLGEKMAESISYLYGLMDHPVREASLELQTNLVRIEEGFQNTASHLIPHSTSYQRAAFDKDRQIQTARQEGVLKIVKLLGTQRFEWHGWYSHFLIRSLLANEDRAAISLRGPSAEMLAQEYDRRFESRSQEKETKIQFLERINLEEMKELADAFRESLRSGQVPTNPSDLLMMSVCYLSTLDEPGLEDSAQQLYELLKLRESHLEAMVLESTIQFGTLPNQTERPLNSFDSTSLDSDWSRFLFRRKSYQSAIQKTDAPLDESTRARYQRRMETELHAFVERIMIDPYQFNLFFHVVATQAFLDPTQREALGALANAVDRSPRYQEIKIRQFEFHERDPVFDFSEKIVAVYLLTSLLKNGGGAVSKWKSLQTLFEKSAQAYSRTPEIMQRPIRLLEAAYARTYGKIPWPKARTFLSMGSLSVLGASSWTWIDAQWRVEYCDPLSLLEAAQLSVLTHYHEELAALTALLESLSPRTPESDVLAKLATIKPDRIKEILYESKRLSASNAALIGMVELGIDSPARNLSDKVNVLTAQLSPDGRAQLNKLQQSPLASTPK